MKKQTIGFLCAVVMLASCGNEGSSKDTSNPDSSKATSGETNNPDTSNRSDQASQNTAPIPADSATTKFLLKAADGGMAEVAAGQVAQQKGTDEGVKRFAAMMVQDHTGANAKVKALSQARSISLPAEPSEEHKKKLDQASAKTGAAFDKAYMDMMVADHKKTIALFESGEKETSDQEVKSFITTTLPALKMHLDSATAIRGKLKK